MTYLGSFGIIEVQQLREPVYGSRSSKTILSIFHSSTHSYGWVRNVGLEV